MFFSEQGRCGDVPALMNGVGVGVLLKGWVGMGLCLENVRIIIVGHQNDDQDDDSSEDEVDDGH